MDHLTDEEDDLLQAGEQVDGPVWPHSDDVPGAAEGERGTEGETGLVVVVVAGDARALRASNDGGGSLDRWDAYSLRS